MTQREGRRLWLEGVVIVLSILLAFGIEAYWAEWVEAREGRELLQRIRADVEATAEIVEFERGRSAELSSRARTILEAMASHPDPDASEALGRLGSVLVLGGWKPVNHVYTEAVSSGRLQLIQSDSLRLMLTIYQESIDEIDAIYEGTGTQYYAEMEPFLVANTVYSELAAEWWRDELVEAPFRTDFEALARSRELWNLLTLRLEQEVALQSRLERMAEIGDMLLAMLPEADSPAGPVEVDP